LLLEISQLREEILMPERQEVSNMIKPPCDEGVIQAAPECAPRASDIGPWVLAATILGSSMAFIDGTVVNVALPVLQTDLNASATQVQWVVEAYSLFLAALILVGGSLGDLFGRRRIYAIGITLFTAASVLCGLSPNVIFLIIARAVQGIGGALLVPGSLAIISASFDKERRGRAIGTWSGFTAITSALGPVLGGLLVQYASWRWVFFINVPLAAIVLGLLFWRVPESRDEEDRESLDWWGALLATLGLGAIVYGLIESSDLGLGHPLVLSALVIGVAALIAFLFVEARTATPMLPLSLFRSKTFSGANLLTLLLYAALGGALFFVPFNLIRVQGYTPTAAGAANLPFILLMFLLSRWSGGLGGPLRREIAAGGWPTHCRHRFCPLRRARYWGQLLDNRGDGSSGCSPRRHRLGCQQRCCASSGITGYRGIGHCDLERFQ